MNPDPSPALALPLTQVIDFGLAVVMEPTLPLPLPLTQVIDFGLAVVMEPRVMVEECCGTTSYMAPEVS